MSAALAAMLLLAAITPLARAQDALDRLDMQAHAAYDQQNYVDAIKLWSELIKQDPKNSGAFFNRGTAYEDSKQPDKAIADFSDAIRLDPSDPQAHMRRGHLYDAADRKDDAATDYAEAVRIHPGDAEALDWLAEYHAGRGENEKAVADYSAIIQAHPNDAAGYYGRGTFYLDHVRDFASAVNDFTQGIKLMPRPDGYCARGLAYLGKGDFENALADCNTAFQSDPDDPEAYFIRGMTYGARNAKDDKDKALSDFDNAIKLNPQYADAYSRRGLLQQQLGEHDKALADFNKALEIDPKNAEAYSDRGQAYYSSHDYEKALPDLQKELELAGPSDADALNGLAWFYATCPKDSLRDGAKAADLAAKACELTDWKNAGIIDTLAASEAESGKWDNAVKHQQQAVQTATDSKEDAKTIADMKARVALYQQKQAYRDPGDQPAPAASPAPTETATGDR